VSVAIPIPELADALTRFTWCYVVTVGSESRAHIVAVTPLLADGLLTADVGRSTVANSAAHPGVVLVFPPLDHTAMSLIVDATVVSVEPFTLRPTKATLHRAAPASVPGVDHTETRRDPRPERP
jgi:hypothetical protein